MTQPIQDQERDGGSSTPPFEAAPGFQRVTRVVDGRLELFVPPVWVCGEPDDSVPWGMCGLPVESEPCEVHHPDAMDAYEREAQERDEAVAPVPDETAAPGTLMSIVGIAPGQTWHEVHLHADEYRAILDVVSAARVWVEYWRDLPIIGATDATALVAAVDALPPLAPPEQVVATDTIGDVVQRLADGALMRVMYETHLPDPLDEPGYVVHEYVSTACQHDHHDYCAAATGESGAKVPMRCKWCPATCLCACHAEVTDVT